MEEIAVTYPGVWLGVEQVFMVYYRCAFPCEVNTPSGCDSSCTGGRATLGFTAADSVPGFTGQGSSQFMLYFAADSTLNSNYNREATKWTAGHEYGHLVGLDHPPNTGDPSDALQYVNMGRYDIMRKRTPGTAVGEGLVPYHALHLSRTNPNGIQPNGWLPSNILILRDTLGLRVPDVRGASAVVFEIPAVGMPPGAGQSFVLVNHQQSTPYDQKYQNSGLLIWHILNPFGNVLGNAWDVESARGKFDATGDPDPIGGQDSLEANQFHHGLLEDFFDGTESRDTFACNSNPNTNVYCAGYPPGNPYPLYRSPQCDATSVAFENIRPADDGTGDMLVDVYVTPMQKVVYPNGGETFHVDNLVPIQWAVRASVCSVSVDIMLSADGGVSYDIPVAIGIPNSGQYVWQPSAAGDMWRIQVVSHDRAGVGMDNSDANFRVTDDETGPPGTGCPVVYQGEGDPMVQVNNVLSRCFQFRENGAVRTTDLLVLSESAPGNDGQYDFELREDETYYSAFDAVELQVFDVTDGATIASTMDARALAVGGQPIQASSAIAVEGIPGGAALLPDSVLHALPGSIVEYGWPVLPPAINAVILVDTYFKNIIPCNFPCEDWPINPSGRPEGTGLIVEQWRDDGWQFVGDLVPRLDWEQIALELPETSAGPLRIRVRWVGTHDFRMIGWVAEASEIEPSYRLVPQDVQHSASGALGSVLTAADGIPALLTPGDVISFAFDPPELNEGAERQLALHFVGRYSGSPEGPGARATPGLGSVAASVPRETAITISGSNPFNPATAWKLDLATAALVELRIYDAEGRLVRDLVSERLEAGVHTLRWDGRNEEGQAAPSGVYFWQFEGAGLRRAEKFVVLK